MFGLEPVFALMFDFASLFVPMFVPMFVCVFTIVFTLFLAMVCYCCYCCCLRDRVCNRVLVRACVYLAMMVLVWI